MWNTQPTMTIKVGTMHPEEDEVTRIIPLHPGEGGLSRVIHRHAEEDAVTRVVRIQSASDQYQLSLYRGLQIDFGMESNRVGFPLRKQKEGRNWCLGKVMGHVQVGQAYVDGFLLGSC
ncbi:hypothetical protein Trydic_g5664 [Trypoxylus dichotomus]